MTDFTLGRCEFEEGPESIDQSGRIVTLSGDLFCSSYTELSMRRFQLLGMVGNPDEDVFPFYSSATDLEYLNGFYRVLDASVGSNPVMGAAPVVPYSVTLEAVTDSHAPVAELSWQSIKRTTATSITAPNHRIRRRRDQPGFSSSVAFWESSRATSSGTDLYVGSTTVNVASVARFQPSPSTFYDAAAMIEIQGADWGWYPWTGRVLPSTAAPANIRLTSGVARVSFSNTGTITHSIWRSGAWQSTDFRSLLFKSSVPPVVCDVFTAPVIVRNDLDAVVVRFDARQTAGADYIDVGSLSVTVTMLAGEWWAGLDHVVTASGIASGVSHAATTASTTTTAGLHRTADDANGNRSLIATAASGYTADTTEGLVWATGAVRSSWMISQSFSGTATQRSAIAEIVEDWAATHTAKTRIVAR